MSAIKEVYSAEEIAEYLGLSESIVRRLVRERKIPFNKIEGRYLFFLPVIREWMMENTVQPDRDCIEGTRKNVNDKTTTIWNNVQ